MVHFELAHSRSLAVEVRGSCPTTSPTRGARARQTDRQTRRKNEERKTEERARSTEARVCAVFFIIWSWLVVVVYLL